MNANTKGGAVKLPLDAELRTALDAARQRHRATRTAYIRNALLKSLQAEGHLVTTAEPAR